MQRSSNRFMRSSNWIELMTSFAAPVLFLVIFFILVAVKGCTDPEKATMVLKADGYTEITIVGWAGPFAGGKGDWYNTEFRAAKSNQIINGVVSEGLIFKGSTIRINSAR